jgi:DNA-binding CsgD family transcriptional regulator
MAQAHRPGKCKPSLGPILYRIHASTEAIGDWSDVLALLRDRLDGHFATLSQHHFASGQGAVVCEFPETPQFRTAYAQFASRNPWFLSSDEYTAGRVITGNELLSNRALVKTDFYRSLLKPHKLFHCMLGVAIRRGQLIHFISVHRGQDAPSFGEREKADLREVLAHVSLALENHWRLREARDLTNVLLGVMDRHPHPSFLVDAGGRILHCNKSTKDLLVHSEGLCTDGGQLAAATSVDRAALREAILGVAKAARESLDATRTMTLSVPGEQRSAVVSIVAAGRAFQSDAGEIGGLVLVTARDAHFEHDTHTCSFVKQFGLSPAQARVTVLIIAGHSLAETARSLHVSENTARSHLKQIFQKTNTHGKMDLVHLYSRNCADSDWLQWSRCII